jgi:hypothetical protein
MGVGKRIGVRFGPKNHVVMHALRHGMKQCVQSVGIGLQTREAPRRGTRPTTSRISGRWKTFAGNLRFGAKAFILHLIG